MIQARGLTKQYGSATVVDRLEFEVQSGCVVGFLGPNGAGKTTTMRMLTTYLTPTRGRAEICGEDVLDNPLAVRRKLGYLPENVPLPNEMTARGYLDFRGRLRDLPRARRRASIDRVVERCGLRPVERQPIATLSKGYRQRLGLADALLHDPEVLILDEPTTGLDPLQILEVRSLIRELGRDRLVMLSTHILPEVEAVCDRVLVLSRGRLAFDGTLEAARTSRTIEIEVRGPSHPLLNAIRGVIGVESARLVRTIPNPNDPENPVQLVEIEPRGQHDPREDIAKVVLRHNWGLQRMDRARSSLETRFLEIARAN